METEHTVLLTYEQMADLYAASVLAQAILGSDSLLTRRYSKLSTLMALALARVRIQAGEEG
jgi:hypothetical protein